MVKRGKEEITTYKVVSTDTDQGNPNLTVAVRLRPESEKEREGRWRKIIKILDEHVLVFDPADPVKSSLRGSLLSSSQRGVPPNLRRKARDYKYAFDRVFDDDCTQSEVFEATTKPLIDPVLNGFNATVFCYGATGSGKTHTMIGSADAPGVMVLTMEELFNRINERKSDRKSKISMSYLEIYNETIRDLLIDNSPPLMLCEDPLEGAVVQGLSEQHPTSADEVFQLLEYGNNNRRQSPTEANAQSSRSHAVLQITINSKARTADVQAEKRIGKLSLIDLAGSERAAVTQNRGERLTEGANINKSLLALGNCINSLGENYKKGKHVPYRDSKLTRLLKDSLGGNCKTVMIANISPSSMSYEDTSNTLKYANRAKNIKTKVQENVVNVNYHITKYTQIISDLRAEVAELKQKLQAQNGITTDIVTESRLSAELVTQKSQTSKLESELIFMRKLVRDQYLIIADYGLDDDKVRSSYSTVMNSPPPPHKARYVWTSVQNTPRAVSTTPRHRSPQNQYSNHVPIQSTSPQYHHSASKHKSPYTKNHHKNDQYEPRTPLFSRSGAEYYDDQIMLNDLSPQTPKGEKKQRPLSKKQKDEIQKGALIKPKPILKKKDDELTLADIENKKPVIRLASKKDDKKSAGKVEFIEMPKSILYKALAPKPDKRLSQPVPKNKVTEPLRRVSIATSKAPAKVAPRLSLGVKAVEEKAKLGKSPGKKRVVSKSKENVKPKLNEKPK